MNSKATVGAFYSGEERQRRRKDGGSNKGKGDCCFICHKPGHYASKCPDKSESSSSKPNKGQASTRQ